MLVEKPLMGEAEFNYCVLSYYNCFHCTPSYNNCFGRQLYYKKMHFRRIYSILSFLLQLYCLGPDSHKQKGIYCSTYVLSFIFSFHAEFDDTGCLKNPNDILMV